MSGLALPLYRLATTLAEPFAPAVLSRRARRGKEDAARITERLGRTDRPRPTGKLIWLHGASVGEALSLLPLADALCADLAGVTVLITSGTVTSAEVVGQRLTPGMIHQYAPIDAPGAVRRFLNHWRPDLAVFVESELWPNLLTGLRRQGAGIALVSARLSEQSQDRWGRAPAAIRALLDRFDLILPQDDEAAQRLLALGGRQDGRLNLKLAAPPLPVDAEALDRARTAVAGRPVILAASTHAGEDEPVLDAYAALAARPDRPLLVVVPRHPERGEAIAALAAARGFSVTRQGAGQAFDGQAQVHVADALGELGLWYRLAATALVGGSLRAEHRGHNPLEAARLGAPILVGPHVDAWRQVYADLAAVDGSVTVDAAGLAAAFAAALDDPAEARDRAERARAVADGGGVMLRGAVDRLVGLIR